VTRTLSIDLAEGATARLRETVVFGRAGEAGGRLDAALRLCREGEEFCRERLVLDAVARSRPGVLAGVRVIDTVLRLVATPAAADDADAAATTAEPSAARTEHAPVTFRLLDPGSTLTRYLGDQLAASPLGALPVRLAR
jgi:urease accessory protein